MEDAKAKIDRIINEGSDFRFGDYISRGFEIFQKDMGSFIGFAAIMIVLTMVIGMIPFIGPIANQFVVSPALTVGAYLVARKLDSGEANEFGNFFKGFDYVGQLALATVVMGIVISITLIPFIMVCWQSGLVEWYIELASNPLQDPMALGVPEMPPFWSILLLLPAIYLGVAYSWTYLFIVFYKMDFWPAMEASRKLLTKHWLVYFAFTFVVGLIVAAGLILLCVGILATIPAAFCMIYAAFADVTKLNTEPDAGDEIEQHLIV